jgi:poly(hydroxyalkanoate) granule-associated protein
MVTKPIGEVKVVGVDVTPVVETGRKAWWAYLGALGTAQDEILHLIDRMMERGTLAETESRKMLDQAMAWPQKSVKSVEVEVQRQVEAILDRLGVVTREDLALMNLPTRSDIQALSEKVAALAKKVDQLRKMEAPQAEKTEAVAAKVQTLNRKVNALKKAVEEEKPAEPAKEPEKEPAK